MKHRGWQVRKQNAKACLENATKRVQFVVCGMASKMQKKKRKSQTKHMAVGQNQWYHFGVGAPHILETILVIGMFTGGAGFEF